MNVATKSIGSSSTAKSDMIDLEGGGVLPAGIRKELSPPSAELKKSSSDFGWLMSLTSQSFKYSSKLRAESLKPKSS